jgi:hypothetical protein
VIAPIDDKGRQRRHFPYHFHGQFMEQGICVELIPDISVDDQAIRLALPDHFHQTGIYGLFLLLILRVGNGAPICHMQKPESLILLYR